jgi:hypothetical protein
MELVGGHRFTTARVVMINLQLLPLLFSVCSCTSISSSKFSGKTKPALCEEIFLNESETISQTFEKLVRIEDVIKKKKFFR